MTNGVIGTGVAEKAGIVVNASGDVSLDTPVYVNGVQASGSWEGLPASPQFVGTIPTQDLNFPNLDLTSSDIRPPFPDQSLVSLGASSGASMAIKWSRLTIVGTRPVVLVHGIALLGNYRNYLSVLQGNAPSQPFASQDLNGWTTWLNWVASQASDGYGNGFAGGDDKTGYLRRIGVPNIRPDEENLDVKDAVPCDVAANGREPSNVSLQSCMFPSDARAYTWPYASYRDNAHHLLNMVNMLQTRYGVRQVNIVAHSKGTQDVEAAVAAQPSWFAHVILLAPMYVGTQLADRMRAALSALATNERSAFSSAAMTALSVGRPALDEMATTAWPGSYGLFAKRAYVPSVLAVAGTEGCTLLGGAVAGIGFDDCPSLPWAPAPANDGAVPVSSVQALQHDVSNASVKLLPSNHTQLGQSQIVFAVSHDLLARDDIGSSLGSSDEQALTDTPLRAQADIPSDSSAEPQLAHGPIQALTLAPGQAMQSTITVPSSSGANFIVTAGNPISITLINPQGQVIDPSSPTVIYTSTVQSDGAATVAYGLPTPEPGSWTAIVTNTSTLSTTGVLLENRFAGSPQLTVGAPLTVVPGDTAPLTASLNDGAMPLDGATITATVLISGAAPSAVLLTDQGNGAYAGNAVIPSGATGTASISLQATGTTGGASFALAEDTASQISSGQATFSDTYGEQTVANMADHLYTSLLITPTVTADQSGYYQLSGDLTDGSGAVIASASTAVALTAGIATPLSLSFDGTTIGKSGVNGPYTLRNLMLYDLDNDILTNSLASAYTTAAYQATQFEHPVLVVGDTITDAGSNPDVNGLFQDLAVTTTLKADVPSQYTVNALLVDSAGAVITGTSQILNVSTMSQPAILYFPGSAIAAHGVDGPYQVRGLTVSGPDGVPLTVIDELGSTQAYRASQFAPAASATPAPTMTNTPTPTGTNSPTATSTPTAVPTSTSPPLATPIPPSPPTAPPPPAPANTTAPPANPPAATAPANTAVHGPAATATATSGTGHPANAPTPTTVAARFVSVQPTGTPGPRTRTTRGQSSTRGHKKTGASGPAIDNMGVPGGTVRENSMVTVSGRARPYNTVDVAADLSTTAFVNQKMVTYIRPGTTGSKTRPHTLPDAKRQPACHKGVRGCVARTVTRRVTRTTRLYHTAARTRADRAGRFKATMRLHYRARKTLQATLTVTARTSGGQSSRRVGVKIAPPPLHRSAAKGGKPRKR